MKRKIVRYSLIMGSVFLTAFSAWISVGAAKGTQSSNGFLARLLAVETITATSPVIESATPMITETPQVENDDDQTVVLPGTTGTPQVGELDDDQDESGTVVLPGVTGTPQLGENDDQEGDDNVPVVVMGTPQSSKHDGDHNGSGSGNGGGDNGGDDSGSDD